MKTPAFLLFLVCVLCLEASSQDKTYDFEELVKNDQHKLIQRILFKTTDTNYKSWKNSDPTRLKVVSYCDHAFAEYYEILNNRRSYTDLKQFLSNKKDTSYKSFLREKHYFVMFDSLRIVQMQKQMKMTRKLFDSELSSSLKSYISPLCDFLRLNDHVLDENLLKMDLSVVSEHHSLQLLHTYYEYLMNSDSLRIPEAMQDRNLKLIGERLRHVEEKEFVLYRSNSSRQEFLKAVDFYMENDVFLFDGNNQDREYTGGGALSLATDLLKWRWINLDWLLHSYRYRHNNDIIFHHRPAISYQSIKLGMHFYTPYIRYRSNYALADTLFQYDRPFGSYIYFERAKYHIWPGGLYRHKGTFQVGKIGTNAGRDIQAMLHKDAITTSQKVYGWDTQIADGGRWLAQVSHTFDNMIYSSNNEIPSLFTPNVHRKGKGSYMGFNLYSSTELFFGGFLTGGGSGIFISTLDFTKQSGQNLIAARKRNRYEFGINVEAGVRYRYIIHNSMLEGLGYNTTFPDDPYDDEAENRHVLQADRIQRDLWSFEFKFNLRWRKMVAYYAFTIQTKEYYSVMPDYKGMMAVNGMVKDEDKDYYLTTVIPQLEKFNSRPTYGYGRFGIVWIVQ